MALGDQIIIQKGEEITPQEREEADARVAQGTEKYSRQFDRAIVGPISGRKLSKLNGMRFAGKCAGPRNHVLAAYETDILYDRLPKVRRIPRSLQYEREGKRLRAEGLRRVGR